MIVNAAMDCTGLVTLTVTNDGAATFRGQSSTAGSWNVPLVLAPGGAKTVTGLFVSLPSLDGYVQGRLDGDPTFINQHWSAERACPVPTTTTTIDTTPKPIATQPGQCQQPGSNPPLAVPCDDPRATTPYVPVTPPTTAPAAPADTEAPTTATAAPDPTPVHTGPARSAVVVVKALPATGGADTSPGVLGGGILALGVLLVCLTRRRAC